MLRQDTIDAMGDDFFNEKYPRLSDDQLKESLPILMDFEGMQYKLDIIEHPDNCPVKYSVKYDQLDSEGKETGRRLYTPYANHKTLRGALHIAIYKLVKLGIYPMINDISYNCLLLYKDSRGEEVHVAGLAGRTDVIQSVDFFTHKVRCKNGTYDANRINLTGQQPTPNN